jgi:hypothetical protein
MTDISDYIPARGNIFFCSTAGTIEAPILGPGGKGPLRGEGEEVAVASV